MYAPSLHEGRGSAAADRTIGASHENLDHGDGGSDPKKGAADGEDFSSGVQALAAAIYQLVVTCAASAPRGCVVGAVHAANRIRSSLTACYSCRV